MLYDGSRLPVLEIALRQQLSARHFEGVDVGGRSFDDMVALFQAMLGRGVLESRSGWLPRARVWRIVLCGDTAGFWEPTDALAQALGATKPRPAGAASKRAARDAAALDALCPVTGFDASAFAATVPQLVNTLVKGGARESSAQPTPTAVRLWTTALATVALMGAEVSVIVDEAPGDGRAPHTSAAHHASRC